MNDTKHVDLVKILRSIDQLNRGQELVDFDKCISIKKLKEFSKCDNLNLISSLKLSFDTENQNFNNFAAPFANLRCLKFIESNIPNIRDLGSSLSNLEVLWMSSCHIRSLYGLGNMAQIRELYLSFNCIQDISACGMLEFLEILDLEGNKISENRNIMYLTVCSNLSHLTLEGNPLVQNYKSFATYWDFVKCQLPQLKFLDNLPTSDSSTIYKDKSIVYGLEDHWNFIKQVLDEVEVDDDKMHVLVNKKTNEQSKLNKSSKNIVENNDLQQNKISSQVKLEAWKFPASSQEARKELTLKGTPDEYQNLPELCWDSSNLTQGEAICGDISKALRKRRDSLNSARTKLSPRITGVVSPSSAKINPQDQLYITSAYSSQNLSPKTSSHPASPIISDQTDFESKQPLSTDSGIVSSATSLYKIKLDMNDSNETLIEDSSQSDIQRDCENVLEELTLWRTQFLKHTKKYGIGRSSFGSWTKLTRDGRSKSVIKKSQVSGDFVKSCERRDHLNIKSSKADQEVVKPRLKDNLSGKDTVSTSSEFASQLQPRRDASASAANSKMSTGVKRGQLFPKKRPIMPNNYSLLKSTENAQTFDMPNKGGLQVERENSQITPTNSTDNSIQTNSASDKDLNNLNPRKYNFEDELIGYKTGKVIEECLSNKSGGSSTGYRSKKLFQSGIILPSKPSFKKYNNSFTFT